MRHSARTAVAGYIQVFVLIGVAIGGSALLLDATFAYSGSLPGGSIYMVYASLRQGGSAAVETVAVMNGGQAPVGSFIITTSQAPASAAFCSIIYSGSTQSVVSDSCPTLQSNPGSVRVTSTLNPGACLTVELVITGSAFSVGSTHMVTVSAPNGAQQSQQVQVVPG